MKVWFPPSRIARVVLTQIPAQFSISCLTLTSLLASVSATAISVEPRSGTHLTQAQAASRLTAAGITATSSGGCTDRTISTCTSYDGILSGTVDGLITLKVNI